MFDMSDIICVTSRALCREDFISRIDRIADARPAGIILREKDLSEEEYRALAENITEICSKHNTPFILHNYVGTALKLGHHSIHLPLSALRSLTDTQKEEFSVIGASCHSVADAVEAEMLGCTYITAGHIFDTACKAGYPGRGIEFLKKICRSVSVPVYAIGGITPDNIRMVRGAGAAGAAVMRGIMTCADPSAYLAEFER